jgi:hypothetical protein
MTALLASLILTAASYDASYMAAIKDKAARLHSLSSPKLVVVGGSSAAFGIHSREMGRRIGVPAVNMGLAGELLRSPWLLDRVSGEVEKGDLVVVCYEWTAMVDRPIRPYIAAEFVRQLPALGEKYFPGQPAITRDFTRGAYDRLSFNSSGDYVGHYGMVADAPHVRDGTKADHVNPAIIGRLVQFHRRCLSVGASCLFVRQPIGEAWYRRSEDSIHAAESALVASGIEFHGDRWVSRDSLFDTYAHLTYEAGERFSDSILKEVVK